MDAPSRRAWLESLALSQPRVAPRVAAMLEALSDTGAAAMLDAGPAIDAELLLPAADGLREGAVIGRYRLLRPLGRGGMAEVWLAQPRDGIPTQQVALKIPRGRGADTALSARFERERDILATLEHPHIARLYDASVAQDGTPFIAMEFVGGQSIDRWCDAQSLGVTQRLALFEQVLDAVQFAHSRLVIHRDLKPSNMLVTAEGSVKLLDFGIAKLWRADTAEEPSALTRAADRLLTPAYAAPEQLAGEPVTPATDVYALGVLLFELLTGERPYRMRFESEAQLEQAIHTADVRRASEAAARGDAQRAARRGVTPPALRRLLQGDLDAIIAKALQRDPAVRYDSAKALADDLRRHAQGRPVQARPESALYLARKFVARHRVVSIAAAAVLLSLTAGLGAAAWEAVRADAQRERAVAASTRAQSTQRFLFDLLDDAARAGQPISMTELMARAEILSRRTLADKPDELAAVLWLVANHRIETLGFVQAKGLLSEAAAMAREPGLQAAIRCAEAEALAQGGQLDEGIASLQAHAERVQLPDDVRAGCALRLARVFILSQQPQRAEARLAQAWQHYQGAGVEALNERTEVLTMQTYLKSGQGRAQGQDNLNREGFERLKAAGRDRGPAARGLLNTWATMALVTGEPRSAAERYDSVLRIVTQDQPQHGPSAYDEVMAAVPRIALGRLDEADALLERAQAKAGTEAAQAVLMGVLCQRARVAAQRGDDAGATAWFATADAVPARGQALYANQVVFCDLARADAEVLAGRSAQAIERLRPYLRGPAGTPHSASIEQVAALLAGRAWLAAGDLANARPAADSALALARRLQADNRHSSRTGEALLLLAGVQGAAHEADAARVTLSEAVEHLEATVEASQRWLVQARRMQSEWQARR